MKSFVLTIVFMVAFFCSNAAWAQRIYKPSKPTDNIVGTVQTVFEAQHGYLNSVYDEAAYTALLSIAKNEYQGNIDIRDITWIRRNRVKGSIFEYVGNGKVILLSGGSASNARKGVEAALERAANVVSKDFTPRSRIAIVQISAPDRNTRDYIIGELEFILQQNGFYMVDRAQLDILFEEQRFGISSYVDDNTAARMGFISGASIVITGRIDGEGNLRRLRLRALNTETSRVVGVASEPL